MATRRTRTNPPRQQPAAAKKTEAPATPKQDSTQAPAADPPKLPEPDVSVPTGTEPLQGPENTAAGNSDPETAAQNEAIPPAGPPEVQEPEADPNRLDEGGMDETEFRVAWNRYCTEHNVTMPNGHILYPGEPLTFKGNKLRGTVVEITENVYRLVLPLRSKRPTFTLVARKGTIMPKSNFIAKDEYVAAVGDLPVPGIEG